MHAWVVQRHVWADEESAPSIAGGISDAAALIECTKMTGKIHIDEH